ncbi:MAG: GAF domain-containing protein [Chloroflexi bacterium]|nr:GAF domain-containing protein [Chloroflexota bacterium]
MKFKNTFRYALVGALFGLLFPMIATIIDTLHHGLSLSLEDFVAVQTVNPLHWIIDTAPFFLGAFASLAGIRQDRLTQTNIKFEAEILARRHALNELETIKARLEQEVKDRTTSLERKALQLQAAMDVGHASATIRDLDTLLYEVAMLISQRFGFYHVGIFLLDAEKRYAILRASSSKGGGQMLARGFRSRVGEESLIGFVTAQRQPRIALDVGEGAVTFDYPDLPETRSELALPLTMGDELLGVLDVQSRREAAFASDDITVLQTLADQVAISIENARLFTEYQTSLEATRRAIGERSQVSWRDYLQAEGGLGFLSTLTQDVIPTSKGWTPGMTEASLRGEIIRADEYTIVVPIILRDQVLGVVRLRKPNDAAPWSEDEIILMDTLVDQLEVALESARLYRDTQQRAERERLVTEITTKIRAAADPQAMLQTAVKELGQALKAGRAQMVIQPTEQAD